MNRPGNHPYLTETIRTFIAVPIPESVKKQIGEFLGALIQTRADVKWVKPESIHITLKFLGGVDQEKIKPLTELVRSTVQSFKRFTVHIGGAGVFPNEKRPRVLWIGLREGIQPLRDLAARVDSALSSMGFEMEKRPFSPHLTIGRVRSFKNIDQAIRILKTSEPDAGIFEAECAVIMKSDLQPSGAVHTPLVTIKLQG